MADEVLLGIELEGRLGEVERRIASDLGDGRANGNVWRQIKDLSDDSAKLREVLAESIRKCKDNTDHNKQLIDAITGDIDRGKGRFAEVENSVQTNTKQIVELYDFIEKQQRVIDSLTDRLNGKGLVQVDPYEKVVSQVRSTSEMLQGGEGQLSFPQVRNSIQNTQFIGKVFYSAIGLFGVGGVLAAGLTLFGVDKVPPEVQALQTKVTDMQKQLDGIQDDIKADLRQRLERSGQGFKR
jgi:hypothetical protein